MAEEMIIPKYNWGEIPIDIAAKIRDHIELYHDYEAFSEVCSSWRLATKEFPCQYINKKHTQPPFLILADDDNSPYRRYYSLTKSKFLKIDLPPCIPTPQLTRYFSSRGWLVSVTRNISKSINSVDNYFNITIFNPFSNNNLIIEAPLFHIDDTHPSVWDDLRLTALFWKFAVSTCPNAKGSDDFVVAVIFGEFRKVAYWRLGYDHKWVVSDYLRGSIRDLCFFQGELYAIQWYGYGTVCEVLSFGDFKDHKNSPQPRVVANLGDLTKNYQLPPDMEGYDNNYYLVESKYDESDQPHTSSLLLILRYIVIESYVETKINTMSFNVFKLNVDNGKFKGKLKEVKSLGNKAIFVGFNSTFSVNADDDRGCKADCIYYTEDFWEFYGKGSDIGIYSLRGGNIVPFYEGPSRFSLFNAPTWIELSSVSLLD